MGDIEEIGMKRCKAEDCSRPATNHGWCQTHYRQWMKTGETRPIRRYRERSAGTVKVAGFRLSRRAATRVQRYARERGFSLSAAIAAIVEKAVTRRARAREKLRNP